MKVILVLLKRYSNILKNNILNNFTLINYYEKPELNYT